MSLVTGPPSSLVTDTLHLETFGVNGRNHIPHLLLYFITVTLWSLRRCKTPVFVSLQTKES